MPAPYSIDLRQRVINAYEAKEGSQRQIAERFRSLSVFYKKINSSLSRDRNCRA